MSNIIKGIRIQHIQGTISTTKAFMEKAEVYKTEEYTLLKKLQKDFPKYSLNANKIKVKATRQKHSGLTINFMAKVIADDPDGETNQTEFNRLIGLYEDHPAKYGTIKAWFLTQYPEFTAEVQRAVKKATRESRRKFAVETAARAAANAEKAVNRALDRTVVFIPAADRDESPTDEAA